MTFNSSQPKRTAFRFACAAISAVCAMLPWASSANERVVAKPVFTDNEIRVILSHGPWPAPAPLDSTNRVSGKRDAIEFGTLLFFDQRLSGSGTKSCASCHVPERNWTDNLRRGVGVAELDRNTPTLMNLIAGQFRDALARAAPPSSWSYSEPAQRGLKIFIGKGGCTTCHAGPNFTGGGFFNTGLSHFAPLGKPDPGRHAGVRQLLESRFNLLGSYNDDAKRDSAAHTRQASIEKANFGEFKVPSLRNLMLTSPYGRDGLVDTLAEVVRHYAGVDPVRLHAKDGQPAKPLNLSPREQTDLVVFLESLSTFTNPWRPEDGGRCD